MLQATDIERRLLIVEHAVGQAAQACSAEANVPSELRDCVQRLDKQSDLARAAMAGQDEARMRKAVDELGLLSERAQRVCDNVPRLTAQMKSTVHHMRRQIIELKHELH